MYVGRILAVGKTLIPFIAYRLSSKSFPDRVAKVEGNKVRIELKEGIVSDNPFITYTCLRKEGSTIFAGNGNHTDEIGGKFKSGATAREAIEETLKEMGYEKDDKNTPRIAGAISGEKGYLGIVREDGTEVKEFDLKENMARIIATNELTKLSEVDYEFEAQNSDECAKYMVHGKFFSTLENPICSAVYMNGFEVYNLR